MEFEERGDGRSLPPFEHLRIISNRHHLNQNYIEIRFRKKNYFYFRSSNVMSYKGFKNLICGKCLVLELLYFILLNPICEKKS